MTTYYTTLGRVRGGCGHRHRTPRAAHQCLERDLNACRRQGGYSDRMIVRVPDGTAPGALNEDLIARAPSDFHPPRLLDDRPQWMGEYDLDRFYLNWFAVGG